VAAAVDLLRGDAGNGFSLDATAKAAGVTRLTVYNQFGSRRALLEAVFDDRAARGGLHRMADAMADPDPHAALARLIAIFCDFWTFDRDALVRLHSVGALDPEFEQGLRLRNERRRRALTVLVGRLVERKAVRRAAAVDLTDVLFTLTSFAVFAELTSDTRPATAACQLLTALSTDAIARAGRIV
jgi:AcrR family transcriptional regulator